MAKGYGAALRDYLGGAGEAALEQAYELAREALAAGWGVLDMAALHRRCTVAALEEAAPRNGAPGSAALAFDFLVESLSPFEMVLRGVREANIRLHQSVKELTLVEEELRRQNDRLVSAQEAVEAERGRYRELFEFAPDAYLITDLAGKIREANTAAAHLLRAPQDLLCGRSLAKFIADEGREEFQAQLLDFRSGLDKRHNWQLRLKLRDGRTIPIAVTAGAEHNVDGTLCGLRWLLRDMTERQREEEARAQYLIGHAEAEAARRFEFLAQASSLLARSLDYETTLTQVADLAVPYLADWCFVHLLGPDGYIHRLAPAHTKVVDRDTADGLARQSLFKAGTQACLGILDGLADPEIVQGIDEDWLEKLTGSPEDAGLLARLKFRTAMTVPIAARERTLGALTFLAANRERHYSQTDLALAEDLAHRCALAIENANLYRDVIRERDKAETINRTKDEFLAILSHELRNPLMPAVGWTRVLKKNDLIMRDATLSEGVMSLERNLHNITRLVGDCLDLARISQGKIQMEKQGVDLNQILLAATEAVREMSRSKGLYLVVDPWAEALWLPGDPTRLQQVVMNLLVNAIKYTPSGGAIWVRSVNLGDEAEIEVQDSGAGIDPRFLEQIFEPFRQGTANWLTSESGLGLGLAISRRIVELHGGRIWAESEGLGRGSTVKVRLPLAEVAEGCGKPAPAATPSARPGKASKLLIIEDSKDVVLLLKLELEILGYAVLTATDGREGLELARREVPDLIISDIKMPGMDGYELIRSIRSTPELAATPAIALTGFGMPSDIERLHAAGFNAHLPKPADTDQIVALIQKLAKDR